MEINTFFKKHTTFLVLFCLVASVFSPLMAVEPHAVSLPIVEITVDEDSFALIGSTHSKEIQPICKVSFSSGWTDWEHEAKFQIAGAGSRWGALKSYELKTSKKIGDGTYFRNDFLETDVKEYKALKLRTITSLYHHRCPNFIGLAHNAFMTLFGRNAASKIDYQETLQVVAFINGNYQGIYDLTETANMKYLNSKYGLGDKEVNYCKMTKYGWAFNRKDDSLAFHAMWDGIMEAKAIAEVEDVFALDNLLDYYLCEVYIQNGDWPTNNCIVWRKADGGKWRFILNDFDWAGMVPDGENLYHLQSAVSDTVFLKSVFQKLSKFQKFKNRFADRAFVACATYLRADRVRSLVDSLANNIRDEIPFQSELFVEMCDSFSLPDEERAYFDNWEESVGELANWGVSRNGFFYETLKKYLGSDANIAPLSILSDAPFYFNDELVAETYDGVYLQSRSVVLRSLDREVLHATARYHMKDGTLMEKSFVGTFSIPSKAVRAEISIDRHDASGVEDNLESSKERGGRACDILGRPSISDCLPGVVVDEFGEKYLDGER